MEQVRACKNKLQRRESGKDPQVTRRAWRGGGNAYPLVSYGVQYLLPVYNCSILRK